MRISVLLFTVLYTASVSAAIYGADNRKDINAVGSRWQQAAQAVAVSLPTFYLLELDKDHYYHEEFEQRPYAETAGVCKDEKFADQKTFGHCSAFLIHPKLLVTAGHCFLPAGSVEDEVHSYCENFSFWLGYNNSILPVHALGSIIPKKDVVQCKRVIYATNNQETEPEDNPIDFAIFELTEPVTHIQPLHVSLKELSSKQTVSTIGHPHGLPAKYSGQSRVLKNYDTTLSSNMDTLGGNSGGPAFNLHGDVVGILISGHQHDTYKDKKLGCDRINHCSSDGKKCDVDTELENANLLMKAQVWYPYVEKFIAEQNGKNTRLL